MSEVLNTLLFHWVPSKALYIGGRSLSWDARCAGIYAGFASALLVHLLVARKAGTLPAPPLLLVGGFSFLPMFVDLYTLDRGIRAASNDVKYLTGALFGSSLCLFLYPAFTVALRRVAGRGPGIDSAWKLSLIHLGVAAAVLTRLADTLPAFFLLEGMAWLGMSALGLIVAAGMVGGLARIRSRLAWSGHPAGDGRHFFPRLSSFSLISSICRRIDRCFAMRTPR